MWPMMRWSGDLESFREMAAYRTWATRARLWVLVSAGPIVVFLVLRYGLGRLPDDVQVPWWVTVSIVAFIGLPAFCLLGAAFVHVVRANRARRREANIGEVVYANRVVAWIDTHGLLVAGVFVGLVLVGCAVWALLEAR
jgi:hypothetical protein